MQFTTFALSALSVAGALAQTTATSSADGAVATGGSPSGMIKMHVVRVGGGNGSLTFMPNELTAAVGDMVQFQFAPANHSVVQSTFDAPCAPAGGLFTGYMPVRADAQTVPTYTIMVNQTTPMWLYCSQGRHCQNGMAMVINPPTSGNRTIAAYQAAAARVTASSAPGQAAGGSASNTSGTDSGSGSGTGSGAGTNAGGAAPSATPSTPVSAGTIVSASATFGLVAVLAAFFL